MFYPERESSESPNGRIPEIGGNIVQSKSRESLSPDSRPVMQPSIITQPRGSGNLMANEQIVAGSRMRRNLGLRDKMDVSDIVKGEGLGEWTDEVNFDNSSVDI